MSLPAHDCYGEWWVSFQEELVITATSRAAQGTTGEAAGIDLVLR